MSQVAILLPAFGFAAMGLVALLQPHRVTGQFGIPALSVDGRNEVRAVYGGFGLAMAAMLVAAAIQPSLQTGVCLAVAAALLGMAIGRLASAAMDRELGRWPRVYLGMELAAALLLAYAA